MLTARHDAARHALDETVASPRYTALLDNLVDAATAPRFTDGAREPAAEVLPLLVAGPWRRLATSGRGRIGAGDLDPAGPDDDWHDVRIRGKRARYAVEAVAKVLGGEAVRLAVALGTVQELLGEHQDAAVAADTWLVAAHAEPSLGVTVGRLVERERRLVRRARELFPAAWAAAADKATSGWLAR
jgi:CHAD domain-containing protein